MICWMWPCVVPYQEASWWQIKVWGQGLPCLEVQLKGVIKWDPFWGDQTIMHGNFEGISQ